MFKTLHYGLILLILLRQAVRMASVVPKLPPYPPILGGVARFSPKIGG